MSKKKDSAIYLLSEVYKTSTEQEKRNMIEDLHNFLDKNKISIDYKSINGEPLSFQMVYYFDQPMVEKFLSFKPDVDVRDKNGNNLYLFTCEYGTDEMIAMVKEHYQHHSTDPEYDVNLTKGLAEIDYYCINHNFQL
jgi:ankyrin repeat protein